MGALYIGIKSPLQKKYLVVRIINSFLIKRDLNDLGVFLGWDYTQTYVKKKVAGY